MCVIAACSLNAPEATPRVVTTTPENTPSTPPTPSATFVPQLATRPPTDVPVFATVCVPRDDWFAYTIEDGDTLAGIALRAGSSVPALANANCIREDTVLQTGLGVRVPIAVLPPPTATTNPNCDVEWFFVFRPGETEPTNACPAPVIELVASGQDFEGGRVYRYAALPNSSDTRPMLYVVYNNGFWERFPDTWDSSQPSFDPTLSIPPERAQPVDGIGKLWRENPSVRNALGWAYLPAASFTGRVQFPANRGDYWYIDHGTARLAIRMTVSQFAPDAWEIAGEY
jgi:hypothetical protein